MELTIEVLDNLASELARLHHELVALSPSKRFNMVSASTTVADIELETAFGESVLRILGADVEIFGEEAICSGGKIRGNRRSTVFVDAIDGTRLFVAGRQDYACTFAVADGGRLVGGCVYLPASGDRYVALRGKQGLFRNGHEIRRDRPLRSRLAAIRERDFPAKGEVRTNLEGADYAVERLGSTARRLCEVALGQIAGFSKIVGFTNGIPRLWGIAGGLVLCEATGHQIWFGKNSRIVAIGQTELIQTLSACGPQDLATGPLDDVWHSICSTQVS